MSVNDIEQLEKFIEYLDGHIIDGDVYVTQRDYLLMKRILNTLKEVKENEKN